MEAILFLIFIIYLLYKKPDSRGDWGDVRPTGISDETWEILRKDHAFYVNGIRVFVGLFIVVLIWIVFKSCTT